MKCIDCDKLKIKGGNQGTTLNCCYNSDPWEHKRVQINGIYDLSGRSFPEIISGIKNLKCFIKRKK